MNSLSLEKKEAATFDNVVVCQNTVNCIRVVVCFSEHMVLGDVISHCKTTHIDGWQKNLDVCSEKLPRTVGLRI